MMPTTKIIVIFRANYLQVESVESLLYAVYDPHFVTCSKLPWAFCVCVCGGCHCFLKKTKLMHLYPVEDQLFHNLAYSDYRIYPKLPSARSQPRCLHVQ